MPITAKGSSDGDYELIPAELCDAVCYGVYDVGTHYNKTYEKSKRKVIILWEVPEYRIEIDNKDLPRAINKSYTLSLHPKADLTKDLESWRGAAFTDAQRDGFDVSVLIGQCCQLNVVHKKNAAGDKTYANIGAVLPWHKTKKDPEGHPVGGKKKITPENARQYFSLEDNMQIPSNCPAWIEKLIKESEEWRAVGAAKPADAGSEDPVYDDPGDAGFPEDDIPF